MVLAAGAVLAYRHWKRPIAGPLDFLPPEAELLAGADLKQMRTAFFWLPVVKFFFPEQLPRDEAYDRFVAETGFAPERDLDRVTLALIPSAPRPALVAVLVGRFERQRLFRYALARGARIEPSAGVDIYRVPLEASRELWFAAFDEKILLVANGPVLRVVMERARGGRATKENPSPMFSTAAALAARNHALWAVADLKLWHDPLPIPMELLRPVKLAWFEGQLSALALNLKATGACESPQEAYLVESNLHGLQTIALVALRAQRPRQPQLETLASEIQIARRDSQVDVTLKLGLETLGQLLTASEKKAPAQSR